MSTIINELKEHWVALGPILTIRTEADYDAAVARMDALIEDGAIDPGHPLHDLLGVLGTLLHDYEKRHYPMPEVNGAEMLRFLMDQHGLKQSDLPEVGKQSVVSEILSGRRALNVRQIARLAARFKVPADVFIEREAP